MCGIIAYTGSKPASPILIEGLKVLEYRGYDSAGLYVPGAGVHKAVGPVQALADAIPGLLPGTAGMGHTRWATHGNPSLENAHPHTDQNGTIFLVHNGIIENYMELREKLVEQGHTFTSETDTEVLAHLIGVEYEATHDMPASVVAALQSVRGTYGLAVMAEDTPDTIVAVRLGSPIAIGVKEQEFFVASDAAPMLRHTNSIIYLEDGEYAVVTPQGYTVYSFSHRQQEREPEIVDMQVEDADKNGHPHYMLKEILEVPSVLENGTRGRILMKEGNAKLGGLVDREDVLRDVERLIIVGCGSAYYAGMVGKLLVEDIVGIPAHVELASEFRHRSMLADENTAVLAISQSGETADTLAAIREAKRRGLTTVGIVNVVGSSIARETDVGIYNHAGPEMSVASTKGFLSQLELLVLFALYMGRMRSLTQAQGAELAMELLRLPEKVRMILSERHKLKLLAEEYLGYDDFLFIGRAYNLPTAFEGALKLKEVSYVHAEGYGAGEMKHGPIAMIDDIFPTVGIMPLDSTYSKMRSSIEEIRARDGKVIIVTTDGNTGVERLADDVVYIPETKECLTPILANVPLQLFAYYMGVLRGVNVDRPRNLAKSVTVE